VAYLRNRAHLKPEYRLYHGQSQAGARSRADERSGATSPGFGQKGAYRTIKTGPARGSVGFVGATLAIIPESWAYHFSGSRRDQPRTVPSSE